MVLYEISLTLHTFGRPLAWPFRIYLQKGVRRYFGSLWIMHHIDIGVT